jgi:hypothetical protein
MRACLKLIVDVVEMLIYSVVHFIPYSIKCSRCYRIAKHQGRGADLHDAPLNFASLVEADLEGANLSHVSFTRSDLRRANLTNANLSRAHLCLADLRHADLTRVNLSYAHVFSADLREASLQGADLRWAYLIATDLRDAKLTGADLTKASLWYPYPAEFPPSANLREDGMTGTTLAGADLTGAILVAADLTGVDLTGANLADAVSDARTCWPDGFDPRQHELKILPMASEWLLKQGDVVLGNLQDCRPDPPWFRCHFTSTAAFEEIRPLFNEVQRLRKADRIEDCMKAYEAIDALRLRLESAHGEIIHCLVLHIDGEKAWFRY